MLDTSIEQATNHTQRELLKEIRKIIVKELPFGEILISTAGLSYIMGAYLAKKENKTKSVHEQAQEILYIISKVYLKVSAAQIAKAVVPGVSEVVEALVSVTVSESTKNPLDTDKKIARAFVSIAGGTLGSVVPGLGTTVGVYAGAILGKIAVTQFYQVLEQWQITPERSTSIPPYPTSFFALLDNDRERILEPL